MCVHTYTQIWRLMCTHIWRLNPYMCLSLCVCVSLLKCTHIWRLNPYVSLAVFNKIRCVRYICKDAIETCRYILGTLSIDVSGNQDCTLWKSNIGAGGWLPIKHFHCPVEFLRCSKYWFGWVVKFLLGTLKVFLDNLSRPNSGFARPKIGFEA